MYNQKLTELNTLRESRNTNNNNIAQLQEKLNLFSQSKCPTCGITFSTHNIQVIKGRLEVLLTEQNNIRDGIMESEKTIQEALASCQKEVQALNQKVNEA